MKLSVLPQKHNIRPRKGVLFSLQIWCEEPDMRDMQASQVQLTWAHKKKGFAPIVRTYKGHWLKPAGATKGTHVFSGDDMPTYFKRIPDFVINL